MMAGEHTISIGTGGVPAPEVAVETAGETSRTFPATFIEQVAEAARTGGKRAAKLLLDSALTVSPSPVSQISRGGAELSRPGTSPAPQEAA